jgi:hypothetical protein
VSEPALYDMDTPPPEALVERVMVRCAGCDRRLPVRVFREAIQFFQSLVRAGIKIPGNLIVASYQCSRCGKFTVLTARALRLTLEP